MSTTGSSATATSAQGRDPSHLIGDVQGTVSAVERGDWVQAGLGMANTAMGIVGLASNPLSGFLSAGFSWAINHVSFLKEPFDALLGNPDAIGKMSGSWASASKQIEQIVADYRRTSVEETKGWHGKSADGYRAASKKHASGLETLAKAAKGISDAAKGAGQLVATVRKTIMDLISQAVSDMVMKIIEWLAASFLTFGAAIAGAIADIVQMACNYAKKLADFLKKLGDSLKKLIDLIKSVAQIAQTAKQILQAITAMTHSNKGNGAGGNTRPSAGGLGMTEDQLRNMDRNAGGRYTSGQTGQTVPSGGGGGGASGPIASRPPVIPGLPGGSSGGGTTNPGGAYPGGGTSGPVVRLPDNLHGPGGTTGGPGSTGGGTGGHWVPGHWVEDPPAAGTGGSGGGTYTPPGSSYDRILNPGVSYQPDDYTVPTYNPGGTFNPGVYNPGTYNPGVYNPGVYNPGVYDPGTYNPGSTYHPDTTHATNTTHGASPVIPPVRPFSASDLSHISGAAGGGVGGLGGAFAGGAAGAMAGGVGGVGAAGAMAGGTPTLQAGGASGVLPGGAGGGAAGVAGAAAAAAGKAGGAGGMGMMGGAPMAPAGGGEGGGKDHQRKVRIEGQPLAEEPPKAAKPVIGE
ncbi:hypothetical protein [Actinosynnema sp. NPDC020468]|uniref:WXG100 family type VII secretion target n=1 Tax=Actinosynnema sp. NPDC020468 TaxID=3154488 RepID=UPI0033FCB0A2